MRITVTLNGPDIESVPVLTEEVQWTTGDPVLHNPHRQAGLCTMGRKLSISFRELVFFFPFIFLFLISNCQITLSSCWSAWRITILAYRFHNNSATLTNMTYFCPPYRPVDLNYCLCRVSKIDGLVCVFRGPWLPFVLPHTVRPGLRIPLRVDRLRGKEGCRRWASQ